LVTQLYALLLQMFYHRLAGLALLGQHFPVDIAQCSFRKNSTVAPKSVKMFGTFDFARLLLSKYGSDSHIIGIV